MARARWKCFIKGKEQTRKATDSGGLKRMTRPSFPVLLFFVALFEAPPLAACVCAQRVSLRDVISQRDLEKDIWPASRQYGAGGPFVPGGLFASA